MTTTEQTEKTLDEKRYAKTNAILDSCIKENLVPIEHEIIIKFVKKAPVSFDEFSDMEHEKFLEILKLDTDKVGESIDKWVKELVDSNDEYALTSCSYATSPYGLKGCLARQGVKKALQGIIEKL